MKTSLFVGVLLVLCCSWAVTADEYLDQITQAVEQFKTSFLRPPFNDYVLSVQFTTLEAQKAYHNDIVLSHDETWSSWCLDVTVGVNLPEMPADIRALLPSTFYNFKVFYNPAPSSSDVEAPVHPELPQISESSSQEESDSGGMMCNMLAFVCPDGTIASRTSDCLFVCGAKPAGGLTHSEVEAVKQQLLVAYKFAFTASMDTLYGKDAVLNPTEKLSDYCIDVTLNSTDSSSNYPGVYNGVRIFYYARYCSVAICPDGTYVGCDEVCPPSASASASSLVVPIVAIIFVVVLSTCCCYLRGRRCRAKCAATKNGFTALPIKSEETKYPSEQYAQLQQSAPASPQMHPVPMMMPMMMAPPMHMMPMMPPMSPHMAQHMGYPPMPPPMMMNHNGSYPVMIQHPNGMWFPAPSHPEDA